MSVLLLERDDVQNPNALTEHEGAVLTDVATADTLLGVETDFLDPAALDKLGAADEAVTDEVDEARFKAGLLRVEKMEDLEADEVDDLTIQMKFAACANGMLYGS
jgi:hypothetical protein